MSAGKFAPLTVALAAALCVASSADAAIEKIAQPTDTGIQFHWWPHLPAVRGWHRDEDATQHYGFNALAPNGTTFADGVSVIYARALYKPRITDRSVADVIASDWRTMVGNTPGMQRTKLADVRDADGKAFAVYSSPRRQAAISRRRPTAKKAITFSCSC